MRVSAHRGIRLTREWTILLDEPRPGWLNMSIDSMLLDSAQQHGARFLRLYRWNPWCLSFGRHEPATRRYDRARIEAQRLDLVRRPTGGRAVWHARELTYAVAAPLADFGGLRQAYQAIHQMLAEALRLLGVPAELAATGRAPAPGAGPCFAAPVGGEVLVGGRKVIGSAQLRQGEAFLQHGSLLLEDDQPLLESLSLHGPMPSREALPLPLGSPVTYDAAAAAVGSAASQLGEIRPADDLEKLAAEAAMRHGERFRSPVWTWER